MFTGIVEEIGRVESIKKGPKSLAITIRGNKIFSDLKIGDSVAVNGVCLTATTIGNGVFTADVMPESADWHMQLLRARRRLRGCSRLPH